MVATGYDAHCKHQIDNMSHLGRIVYGGKSRKWARWTTEVCETRNDLVDPHHAQNRTFDYLKRLRIKFEFR